MRCYFAHNMFSTIAIYMYYCFARLVVVLDCRTVFVGAIGYVILGLLCCAAAVVMYAYYLETGCDPLASGELYSPNQV